MGNGWPFAAYICMLNADLVPGGWYTGSDSTYVVQLLIGSSLG